MFKLNHSYDKLLRLEHTTLNNQLDKTIELFMFLKLAP